MTFQDALYQQLQQLPTWGDCHGQLANRIEKVTPGTTDIVVGVIEQCCRAKLNLDPGAVVDWGQCDPAGKSAFDWAVLLAFIAQLLPALAALLQQLIPSS